MHGLEREYGERIKFVRVNILQKESRALMEQYAFSTTPEFYLVDADGEIIGFFDDTATKKDFHKTFDAILEKSNK